MNSAEQYAWRVAQCEQALGLSENPDGWHERSGELCKSISCPIGRGEHGVYAEWYLTIRPRQSLSGNLEWYLSAAYRLPGMNGFEHCVLPMTQAGSTALYVMDLLLGALIGQLSVALGNGFRVAKNGVVA